MTTRIAFVGQRGVPPTWGGVERYVDEIVARLPAEVESSVYCRPHYCAPQDLDYTKQVFLPSLHAKGLEAFSHSALSAVHSMFQNYDLVHFQALGPALFCGLPRLTGTKTVTTIHGIDWQRAKWGRSAQAVLRAGDWMMGHASNSIISVSKNLKRFYEDRYRRDVFHVPIGFSKPEPRALNEAHTRFGIEPRKYMFFLNRIVPEKGLHYAIDAFKQVQRDDLKFVIAGSAEEGDPYLQSLKKQAADDPRIIFTGFVSRELVHELYSNAYLFLLPSDLEGMPAVLLEAMSYGCPVLTSDIQESLDVINLDGRNHGFVHKKQDVKSLALEMNRLAEDPDSVKQMGELSCKFVHCNYSWKKSVEMTYEVYKHTLDG